MFIDFSSPAWKAIEQFLEDELAKARVRNDDPSLTIEATHALRGEIAAYKKLIALRRKAAAQEAVMTPPSEDV
jgi:hypothetical protein